MLADVLLNALSTRNLMKMNQCKQRGECKNDVEIRKSDLMSCDNCYQEQLIATIRNLAVDNNYQQEAEELREESNCDSDTKERNRRKLRKRDNQAERMRKNMASLLKEDNVQKPMMQERNVRNGQGLSKVKDQDQEIK